MMLVARQLPNEHHVPAERIGRGARRDGADALAQRVGGHFSGLRWQGYEQGDDRSYHVTHGRHSTSVSQEP